MRSDHCSGCTPLSLGVAAFAFPAGPGVAFPGTKTVSAGLIYGLDVAVMRDLR
jgi:hypothetical protein